MHETLSPHPVTGPAARVVLIAGRSELRDQLLAALVEAGIEVLAAPETCEAGYSTVLAGAPGVVVLDSHLPDGRGTELCARLTAEVPWIPVVIYSAGMTAAEQRDADRAGAAVVVPKTTRVHALVQAICFRAQRAGGERHRNSGPTSDLDPDVERGARAYGHSPSHLQPTQGGSRPCSS
jgi:DNA-binding NarL/FixJ family response regulator